MEDALIIAGIIIIVIVVMIVMVMAMWKRVPQDKALVITGLKKE